jgi:hypothetical protein
MVQQSRKANWLERLLERIRLKRPISATVVRQYEDRTLIQTDDGKLAILPNDTEVEVQKEEE